MQKIAICLLLFYFSFFSVKAQTTDLSIVVEAQNLSNTSVSQVNIFQDFQYLITILNSGNAVSNATFSQTLSTNVSYFTAMGQNQNGGASDVSNLVFAGNTLTGTIANMPSNSSVEVLVNVRAPISPGGIATNVTVFPPSGTTDNNNSNNQSIISIDVNDLPIDFSVVYSQVSPPEGTGISNWDDTVTYQFTITNNSSIAFPLDSFSGRLQLANAINFGVPNVQFESISCLNGTNGTICPDVSSLPQLTTLVSTASPQYTSLFLYDDPILFNANSSLSFEVVYKYLEPACSIDIAPLAIDSYIHIEIPHANQSSNNSNTVFTQLIETSVCATTDLCIETTQITPLPTQMVNWDEEITFETIACNNGPLDGFGRFFLQNLSVNIEWDIVSVTCDATTGPITCNDFTITDQDIFWTTSNFIVPANTTITFTTVVKFLEPDNCSTGTPIASEGHVRSGANLLDTNVLESNTANNAESDFVILPPLSICDPEDIVDLQITKTQTNPILPLGSDNTNTVGWQPVTYEITATNPNTDTDAIVEIIDYMPVGANTLATAALVSVNCISTTGTATCPTINNANIGIEMDGLPQGGLEDVFWSIAPEDNYTLPAQSSITFEVVVDWQPECSNNAIPVTNGARINSVDSIQDSNLTNNQQSVVTYFAPCVDLIVQTYPQFTQVVVNQNFNWIIDITNSNTSSNAINIDFQDIIGSEFTINGTPTCAVTNGNASCTTFTTSGNTITGVIPNMDAASTIQIIIPVTAPSYGGAFSNNAQAIPNPSDNQELTIETNISISNVQVIAPSVVKSFTPNQIIVGQESILEFTVNNLAGNPAQNNIDFTDNLPNGLTISGPITWTQSNGCTATFSGNSGDTSIMVNDLIFPSGVATCTFAVPVTSTIIGNYLNNNDNFTDQNNIDSSLASASLDVIADNTNVDIEVLKSVLPTQAFVGENVTFTINASNLGTSEATNISILENLPSGYQFISASVSTGSYDSTTYLWSLNNLLPNQTETLTIVAQIVADNNLLNVASLNSVTQTDRDLTNNEDTAEVIILETDVDIEVLKSVSPQLVSIGETVTFTITATNVGTTNATDVSILESIPSGYIISSFNTSYGTYNSNTFLWSLPNLIANQSETLNITAQVISSNNLLNIASLSGVTEIDRDETNNEDSAEVTVNDCLKISQGISPNNDGDNEMFTINCIEDYPENNVKIFNRYGKLVFETNNYKNNWNGIANTGSPNSGNLLPVGTYYYSITIDTINRPFVGWLYLNY
ncbi:putative repeat protein (TIGR01451 family)/gliding motility-associated-like protein [Lacinutrix venerupis]|uniref:DUF7933 domain-containing protein n=1 Tax=Lacinutrix venerupis TaxID=1486034 RepID=UPI000EAC9952|nr:gliding motility-associated C-terminal domain-containing protein [Lacinutrix venerupis]RLJ63391.1 putative repeat protein (TIGR01451 family)/gliding motility-associated-like protein [Lacinutrix venerupis]